MVEGFTVREKLVFWGLVAYPRLNDGELAKKLDVSRSTLTSIRQRLEEQGLYQSLNVPDFAGLGCEVLTALYGEFHPKASFKNGLKFTEELLSEVRNTFFMIGLGGHHLSLSASADFADVKEHIEKSHRFFHELGFTSHRRQNYVLFPLRLCRLIRFFDYAPLLKEHFALDVADPEPSILREPRPWPLSKTEKYVFYNLIKHPTASDRALGKICKLSRQSVHAARNRLQNARMLKTLRIPDICKLGFELMVFTHLHLSPHKPLERREDGIVRIMDSGSHVVKVSGNLEAILLSVYKDYNDYHRTADDLIRYYRDRGYLIEEPEVKLFPLSELSAKPDLFFYPLTEKLLKIRSEGS